MTTAPVPAAVVITGNATFDYILRKGLETASTAIATVIATWLYAHGFHDPNLLAMIGLAVFAALMTATTIGWSWVVKQKTLKDMADHVIDAATTGFVPPSIAAIASKPVPPATIT